VSERTRPAAPWPLLHDIRVPTRGIADFLARFRPPLRDRRFWATQALVAGIALAHDELEYSGFLPHLGMAYFLPMSLFFIPVVYAALYFGLSGSVATALWCTLLSTPNWFFWHHGSERFGVISQMLIVDAVAVFVGSRVDQQLKARAEAEAASRALQVSETKYRGLFETAGEGVIVLDKSQRIVECNVAAGVLLRRSPEMLRDAALRDILPRDVASALSAAAFHPDAAASAIRLQAPDGGDVWVEAICTPFVEGEELAQVVLRDVTEQKRRQAGLETYAAHILRAQEEERQRIAQELHDETVQSLIVLCRKLDHRKLNPVASTSAGEILREAHAEVESIVESVRGFARGLRPPILDDLGLTPAIDKLLDELTSRSAIEGSLVVNGPDQRLPADIELALFRIAQEAVHNVERHSDASHVKISLEYGPQTTQLAIADDGKGFVSPLPSDDLANERKLGLIGMQERARIVGGKLTIRSVLREGTSIVVEIPSVGQPG
jgi:PAS domain S-box-containing protein